MSEKATTALQGLRDALAKYDENDSETAYYDAKEVCNAARVYLWTLDAPASPLPAQEPGQ